MCPEGGVVASQAHKTIAATFRNPVAARTKVLHTVDQERVPLETEPNNQMKASGNQRAWAAESWRIVMERYRQWSADESTDYSPLIMLLKAIRSPEIECELSLGTSLMHLVIAPSCGVLAPNNLGDPSPRISVTQLERGFPDGRSGHTQSRNSTFDDGIRVLENFLLRLRLPPEK